jgi:hypothetical protein
VGRVTDDQAPADIEIISLACKTELHAECRQRWPVYLLIQEQARGEVQARAAKCICWCHAEKEGA